MIRKNVEDLERRKNLFRSQESFFGNKYNSYIKSFMRKLSWNGKRKNFRGVFRIQSNICNEAFLRKITEYHRYLVNLVIWVLNIPVVLIIAEKLLRRQIKDSMHSEATSESYKATDLF